MQTGLDIDSLCAWVMALMRAGGLISVLPVFSAPAVPMQMRLVLAVFLAFLAESYIPGHLPMPGQPMMLALVAGNELLLGVFMGLIVKVIFFAAEMAGQIMSNEIGLTTGATLDPASNNSFTMTGVLFSNLAALLLLTTGAYHAVLFAYLRSYAYAPVGSLGFSPAALELFVMQTGRIFLLAVQMAAPVIAANFVVTLTFGVLGKVAPGINVYTESYSARILAGLSVLGLAIAVAARYMLSYLEIAPDLMLQLVRR